MSSPSYPPLVTKSTKERTCSDRLTGSRRIAAIPPAGMASTTEGMSKALDFRAVSRNCSAKRVLTLGSVSMEVTPVALNQNGETSRIRLIREGSSGAEFWSVQYGAQTSRAITGSGAGSDEVSSLIPAIPTVRNAAEPRRPRSTERRELKRRCIPLRCWVLSPARSCTLI